MLAKRIIPCLDVYNGEVVKGVKFQNLTVVGKPVDIAEEYYKQGADEIVFLDIAASPENKKTLFKTVKKVSKKVFIPLTVGGGIRNVDDVKKALFSGADKVSINTAAVKNPEIIKKSADMFGSQCIVCAVDAKKTNNSWKVLINGGRVQTDLDVFIWVKKVEKLGAGEILLTSWDSDGTKNGYDLKLTRKVAKTLNIPVIASGGAGSLKDVLSVFRKGKADAALIASLFHLKKYQIKDVKNFLKKHGVMVR